MRLLNIRHRICSGSEDVAQAHDVRMHTDLPYIQANIQQSGSLSHGAEILVVTCSCIESNSCWHTLEIFIWGKYDINSALLSHRMLFMYSYNVLWHSLKARYTWHVTVRCNCAKMVGIKEAKRTTQIIKKNKQSSHKCIRTELTLPLRRNMCYARYESCCCVVWLGQSRLSLVSPQSLYIEI